MHYTYQQSAGVPVPPIVEDVPCESEWNSRTKHGRPNHRTKLADRKEGYIVVYYLPIESQSPENGLNDGREVSRLRRSLVTTINEDKLHSVYDSSEQLMAIASDEKFSDHPGPLITTTSAEKLPDYPSSAFSKEMYKRIFSFVDRLSAKTELAEDENESIRVGTTVEPIDDSSINQ